MIFRRIDLFLALVATVGGSIVALTCYRTIRLEREPGIVIASTIPREPTTYALMGREGCIGRVSVGALVFPENITRADSYLRLRFSLHGQRRDILFHAQGEFNPLAQLTSGQISAESGTLKFTSELRDVNPIRISVTGVANTVPSTLSIPGPILLRRNADKTFQLEYAGIRQRMLDATQFDVAQLTDALDDLKATVQGVSLVLERSVSAVDGSLAPLPCNGEPEGWVEIATILDELALLSRLGINGGHNP